MGIVFSPEAISSQNIPELGAHERAGRYILDQLFEPQEDWSNDDLMAFMCGSNGIQSGMIFGTTALGKAGLRSDVDVLINYHTGYEHKAFPIISSVLQTARQDYKVPVELQLYPVTALFEPLRHPIDVLFADHLISIQNQDEPRWSYNWPVSGLSIVMPEAEDQEHYRAVAIRYTSGKSRQFARALVEQGGNVDLHVMQRALELPSAIGRKVLAATHTAEDGDFDVTDRDSMFLLTQAKLQRYVKDWHEAVVGHQQDLYDLDKAYDQILQAAISGEIDITEYKEWLHGNYEFALNMAYHVAQAWSSIISDRMDEPREHLPEAQVYLGGDEVIY